MKTCTAIVLFFLLVCGDAESRVGIRPSFSLIYSAWQATHIVVATEKEGIDGEFTVLESWKGDLKNGDRVALPSLSRFADEKDRAINNPFGRPNEDGAGFVTGDRMILFLVKREKTDEKLDRRGMDESEKRDLHRDFPWAPASLFGGMFVSVAWVENGDMYGFVQENNPGPSLLIPLEMTEEKAKKKTDAIILLQEKQHAAGAITDPARRAEALRPFATSGWVWSQQEAFDAMIACGDAALPTLIVMFKDESLDYSSYRDTVDAMAAVGGTSVGPLLSDQFEKETAFWHEEGPKLYKGWWGNAKLADRYRRTQATLNALRNLRYSPCRELVAGFRDFLSTLPPLEGESALDRLREACDAVLSSLTQ